ncbi:F420-dependent glucose-6-phosphate dehydrogenase [subsurface metagenome]
MQFGLYTPNYGTFAHPRTLADLALEAEEAGWDGYFIWDHILVKKNTRTPMVDPWVALAAMAMNTKKIRIGTTVTPIARRRPWKLARETVSIDHLSEGRLILTVGLGTPAEAEFEAFGEESNQQIRAKKLDEGLDILLGLWSGKSFSYKGEHYQLEDVRFLPKPIQSPRIPIWVGGGWPRKKPFIRAARYDGVFPLRAGFRGKLQPNDFQDIVNCITSHRIASEPFDVVLMGKSQGQNPEKGAQKIAPYEKVGVTWWLEFLGGSAKLEKIRERIKQGPPRVSIN